MTAQLLLHLAARQNPRRQGCHSGFTIIELVISAILLAIVVGGIATTLQVSSGSSRRSGIQYDLDSRIDQDIAAIRDLSDRFTCCPGSCTATAATITAGVAAGNCSNNTAGNENFYSPNQPSTGGTTTAMLNFRTACGVPTPPTTTVATIPTIGTTFAGLIPSLDTNVPGSSTAGLSRSTPTVVDSAANRLQWTYTGSRDGNTVVTRVVNLVPTAALWCP
jgi:type II secretory pathway pseudopilin PulG